MRFRSAEGQLRWGPRSVCGRRARNVASRRCGGRSSIRSLPALAYLSDDFSRSERHRTRQHPISVFRDPYKMIFDIRNHVPAAQVLALTHGASATARLAAEAHRPKAMN